MVCGGESYDSLVYGLHDSADPDHPGNLIYEEKGGFGFFVWGYLDSHFGTRGRQGRMIRMVWELMNKKVNSIPMIFGIDENTALKVEEDKGMVIGETGVFIINVSKAQNSTNYGLFQLQNVKISYLTEGDMINLNTYEVTYAEWKKNIKGIEEHDYALHTSYDIFSSPNNYDKENNTRINPREFIRITTDLINSALSQNTEAYTYETNPQFKLSFTKMADSVGFVGQMNGKKFISYNNLNLDIVADNPKNDPTEKLLK